MTTRTPSLPEAQHLDLATAASVVDEVVRTVALEDRLSHRPERAVLSFLRATARDGGQTIVMVTHEPAAASYADRVVFLGDGQLVGDLLDPTTESVLDRMARIGA